MIVSTQDPSGISGPLDSLSIVLTMCIGNETIKEVLPNWIKTTPFILGGRGCQHMKVDLALLNASNSTEF